MGGVVDTWGTLRNYKDVRAEITPISGDERGLYGQLNADALYRIKFRYLEGISPKNRIISGSRVFNILNIRNIAEMNRELVCLVKEDV